MTDHCEHCEDKIPDYKRELSRVNRLIGQLEGVQKMIAERRYCPEILTQLRAVRAALESTILESHLSSCVTDAFTTGSESERASKIEELQEIFKRFD
jgi:CsoR family transcriptional regulator, copper-sensing transcriptional repressor